MCYLDDETNLKIGIVVGLSQSAVFLQILVGYRTFIEKPIGIEHFLIRLSPGCLRHIFDDRPTIRAHDRDIEAKNL